MHRGLRRLQPGLFFDRSTTLERPRARTARTESAFAEIYPPASAGQRIIAVTRKQRIDRTHQFPRGFGGKIRQPAQSDEKPLCRLRFVPRRTRSILMQVQEIMTKDVSCCSPATNAAAVAEMMWTHNCGSLPVVDDGGRVVGIVTDRDLFIALGTKNQRPAELPVGEMMTQDVSLCAPERRSPDCAQENGAETGSSFARRGSKRRAERTPVDRRCRRQRPERQPVQRNPEHHESGLRPSDSSETSGVEPNFGANRAARQMRGVVHAV